jgi:hypothetical protein
MSACYSSKRDQASSRKPSSAIWFPRAVALCIFLAVVTGIQFVGKRERVAGGMRVANGAFIRCRAESLRLIRLNSLQAEHLAGSLTSVGPGKYKVASISDTTGVSSVLM